MNEKLFFDKRKMKTNGTYPIRLYVKHRGKFLLSTNICNGDNRKI